MRWRFSTAILASLLLASRVVSPATAAPLDDVIKAIAAEPVIAGQTTLAAHSATDGHWQLANRAGDVFTASGPDELRRAVKTLAPELEREAGRRLVVTLSREGLSLTDKAFADFPKGATLRALIAGKPYRIMLREKSRPLVEVTPQVVLLSQDIDALADALWHLERRVPRHTMRVVAIEPGAPSVMSSSPRVDPQTKLTLVDRIDAASAARTLAGARGQFVVIRGRLAGGTDSDRLIVRASGSPELEISVPDLVKTAAGADMGLFVLATSTSAQPGGRNWLWTPYDLAPLQKSEGEATRLVDILTLLAGNRNVAVDAAASGHRLRLAVSASDYGSGSFDAGKWLREVSDAVTDLVGASPPRSMTIDLPSAARQRELDRRIVSFLPFWLPFAYGALLLLGLAGWRTAHAWFSTIWPIEARSDYAGRIGWMAARAVRFVIFAVVFLPAVAWVAVPVRLLARTRPAS